MRQAVSAESFSRLFPITFFFFPQTYFLFLFLNAISFKIGILNIVIVVQCVGPRKNSDHCVED